MPQVQSFLLASDGPFFGGLRPMLLCAASGMFEVCTDPVKLAMCEFHRSYKASSARRPPLLNIQSSWRTRFIPPHWMRCRHRWSSHTGSGTINTSFTDIEHTAKLQSRTRSSNVLLPLVAWAASVDSTRHRRCW